MGKKYGYNSEVPLSDEFFELLFNPYIESLRSSKTKNEYRRNILTICSYFYHTRGINYSFEQLNEEDAKEYFLRFLSMECAAGRISQSTFRLRLSACKNFAHFLEIKIALLFGDPLWQGVTTYKNAFEKIIIPAQGNLVRTNKILSEEEIDNALSIAKKYNSSLFIIFLLAFRMVIPQKQILSLKKSQISIFNDNNRHVGIVTFIIKNKQVYRRMPEDIVSYMESYLDTIDDDDYLFTNRRGNRLTPDNLSRLLQKFEKETGCSVRLGQFRTKALIDLVAHNPDSLEEIGEYANLSKQMIQGYGKALDRIAVDCIADRSSYKILQKKN